ncbi:MAG: glycosyltransferase family 2 protein [Thermodesulfobacteriota bacterium]
MKNPASTDCHTFVVLAYGDSPYIDACIRSLISQTIRSRIVISTSTVSPFLYETAERYDLPLHIGKSSTCIAEDWSFAFNLAQTPYLTLAHQDDLYSSNYTECCLNEMRNPETVLVFSDYAELISNLTRRMSVLLGIKRLILSLFFIWKNRVRSPMLKKWMLAIGNPICCPSIMYNKDKIGDFTFNTDFIMNLDWDATLRMAEIPGNFVYIRRILLTRRLHPESGTAHATKSDARSREDLKIIRRYWPKFLADIYCRVYSISHKLN